MILIWLSVLDRYLVFQTQRNKIILCVVDNQIHIPQLLFNRLEYLHCVCVAKIHIIYYCNQIKGR